MRLRDRMSPLLPSLLFGEVDGDQISLPLVLPLGKVQQDLLAYLAGLFHFALHRLEGDEPLLMRRLVGRGDILR